jgi:hypothetical protein
MTSINSFLETKSVVDNSNGHRKILLSLDLDAIPGGDALSMEYAVLDALNTAGTFCTGAVLERFNIDEPRISVGGKTMYNKGSFSQTYESLYGPVDIVRAVYQSAEGGKQYCPLEVSAGLVHNATPMFAKVVASRAAEMPAPAVARDLEDNLEDNQYSLCQINN